MNYAKDIKNFNFSTGALTEGIGFDDLIDRICEEQNSDLKRDIEAIGKIERVFHYYRYDLESSSRDDKIIFVSSDLKLYYINLYSENITLCSLRNITFTSLPVGVRYRLNGEDVMILSSETDNMVVWNGKDAAYEILDAPKISSMVVHYERLFATVDGEKNAIWFSDDLDPTNWTLSLDEAGFIELIDDRGALLKVVSFSDYIYIFREYGISRLSAYANQTTFSVSNLFVSSGKIYANSVCVCGDKILFLAEDGLYRFDGLDTTKILNNISNSITAQDNNCISSCYQNGSYYLACKYNFLDEEESTNSIANTILEIDVNTMKLKNITHGVSINYLTSIMTDKLSGVIALASKNAFCVSILSKNGCFLGVPIEKTYISPTTGVNDESKIKVLKRFSIYTKTAIELTIYHDNEVSAFNISGSSHAQTINTHIRFFNMSFKICSSSRNCNIKNLKFEISKNNRYF